MPRPSRTAPSPAPRIPDAAPWPHAVAALFAAIHDAAVAVDLQTRQIVLWNDAATLLLGYAAEEARGRRLDEVLPADGLANLWLTLPPPSAAEAPERRQRVSAEGPPDADASLAPLVTLPAHHRSGAELILEVSIGQIGPSAFSAAPPFASAHPEAPEGVPSLGERRTGERAAGRPLALLLLRDVTEERRRGAQTRDMLIRERAARQDAVERGARLEAFQEAALTMAVPVPAEPSAVAALLTSLVEHAATSLGARDAGLILLDDPAWRELLPEGPEGGPVGTGYLRLDHRGRLTRWSRQDNSAAVHVLATGEPVFIADTSVETSFGVYAQFVEDGIRSFAAVPLLAGGKVLGALLVNFNQPAEVQEEDQRVAALFAAHAAAALEHVRLVAAEQRRANQAKQIAATLARVGAAPSLETALTALLQGAILLLRGDEGFVWFDSDGSLRRDVALWMQRDGTVEPQPGPRPAGGHGQKGAVARVIDDLLAANHETGEAPDGASKRGMRSRVAVPILVGRRCIGSFHVDHHEPGFFEATDLTIAQALAAEASAAIERARLDAAQREAVAAREEAQRQLAAQTEALAQRDAEASALRELDHLKNEFLRTISHELRTPLTLVYGYGELLQLRADTIEPAAIKQLAGQIVAGSMQLRRLVEDVLDFARIERGEVTVEPVAFDLAPVMRELAKGFRERAGARLSADVAETLPVFGDYARAPQIITNLVENAIKYAPESPIFLRARSLPGETPGSPSWVRVEVQDNGPGVPLDEQTRVWEKFFRGSSVAELAVAPGSGIGLAVVKALVEAQGGRVGLESAPGRGACFWFDLPASAS